MKVQAPPGMRDFYPEDMRLQNWLFDLWRSTSRSFGFQEYEGPIFEYLDLYRLKSGEGIVSELFAFQDRGGRELAIRPEMTPTLARMVAARAGALPRPIKWFSIPRMCRAEKPQRGRLREFFQWNVDVLGSEDPIADAEVIAVAVEFLRRAGLSSEDFVVRINHRELAAAVLSSLGLAAEQQEAAFELIDRAERIGPQAFARDWNARFGAVLEAERLASLLETANLEACVACAREGGAAGAAAADAITDLMRAVSLFGADDACVFDFNIVRGIAYYTGIVFEVHMRDKRMRALAGGGRYDDLTGLLDGPRIPGVGFGMGDAPVLEALRELGRLPHPAETLDVFVVDAGGPRPAGPAQPAAGREDVLRLVRQLRRLGLRVDFPYRRTAVGKQFKAAADRGARYAIVVGDEYTQRGELTVKDLTTSEQRIVAADQLLQSPEQFLKLRG